MAIKKSEKVDEYLEKVIPEYRKELKHLRQLIFKTVPEAEETWSYGMPLYKYKGKMLVGYSDFKNHCSFIIGGSNGAKILKKELSSYDQTKATIHFTPDHTIPDSIIKKLIKIRIAEIGEGKVWKKVAKSKSKTK